MNRAGLEVGDYSVVLAPTANGPRQSPGDISLKGRVAPQRLASRSDTQGEARAGPRSVTSSWDTGRRAPTRGQPRHAPQRRSPARALQNSTWRTVERAGGPPLVHQSFSSGFLERERWRRKAGVQSAVETGEGRRRLSKTQSRGSAVDHAIVLRQGGIFVASAPHISILAVQKYHS